jgi:hypothetical protein
MEHNLFIQTINKMYAFACRYRDLFSDPKTTLEDVRSSFESEYRELSFNNEYISIQPYEFVSNIYSKWNEVIHYGPKPKSRYNG